mgnify:CR=1 FL=1
MGLDFYTPDTRVRIGNRSSHVRRISNEVRTSDRNEFGLRDLRVHVFWDLGFMTPQSHNRSDEWMPQRLADNLSTNIASRTAYYDLHDGEMMG